MGRSTTLTWILAVACFGGCDASTTLIEPPSKALVSLSVSAGGSALTAGGGSDLPAHLRAASDLIQDANGDTLVLTRVALVVRKVELKRQFVPGCPIDGPGVDGCHEFQAGPFLLDLPTDGDLSTIVTIDVPPGTYDELEFEIHKPDDDTPIDQAFLNAHPDFEDVSIRVEGWYNGAWFVFTQDMNESQEIDLLPRLVVGDSPASTNVTLSLDVSAWFVSGSGELVDPRTANKGGDNEKLVEDNIERSIDAFEDRDRDGWRDA